MLLHRDVYKYTHPLIRKLLETLTYLKEKKKKSPALNSLNDIQQAINVLYKKKTLKRGSIKFILFLSSSNESLSLLFLSFSLKQKFVCTYTIQAAILLHAKLRVRNILFLLYNSPYRTISVIVRYIQQSVQKYFRTL